MNTKQKDLTIAALEMARDALTGETGAIENGLALVTIRLRIAALNEAMALAHGAELMKLVALHEALTHARDIIEAIRPSDFDMTLVVNLVTLRLAQMQREAELVAA
jgi:hypothetical protein